MSLLNDFNFIKFIFEIIIMESIFLSKFQRKNDFTKKLIPFIIILFISGDILAYIIGRDMEKYVVVSILYYILILIFSMIIIGRLFDIKLNQILFVGTAGYTLQHIDYSVQYLIFNSININKVALEIVLSGFITLFIAGSIYFLFKGKEQIDLEIKKSDLRQITISAVIIFISIILSVISENIFRISDITVINICRIYDILSCSLAVAIQFNISKGNRLEASNEVLENLLYMEKKVHEMSKETIDMINIKCHDIKYQIQALENISNEKVYKEKLRELEKDIIIYDCIINSGNNTIDLILTEKSLICKKYDIKLSYIIDGEVLSFMDITDLYSLFSNALDNAIESVIKAPKEKRIISLNIASVQMMQYFHIENYCEETLEFKDGLPITTKKDKKYHGFGTRSIRFIAKKYKGEVQMRHEKEKFILDILFAN